MRYKITRFFIVGLISFFQNIFSLILSISFYQRKTSRFYEKVSKYNQEMPHSKTADQQMAQEEETQNTDSQNIIKV